MYCLLWLIITFFILYKFIFDKQMSQVFMITVLEDSYGQRIVNRAGKANIILECLVWQSNSFCIEGYKNLMSLLMQLMKLCVSYR